MARKTRYVVRVVIPAPENLSPPDQPVGPDGFLECLQHAGLVSVHRDNGEGQVFDINCPHQGDSKVWAEANAERMRTFGFNAVCAPAWTDSPLI